MGAPGIVADADVDSARAPAPYGVLVVAYALFFVLPGELAFVGPLRSNGTPLRLLGLVAFLLVLAGFLRVEERRWPRPVAAILVAFLAFTIFAWGTAHLRSLSDLESAQIDRSVLIVVSGTGLALLAASVVHDLRRAHVLAGLLTAGAVLSVTVGALQFVGIINTWADVIGLPFMTTVVPSMGVVGRLGFNRVAGTTASPLEYSVVLAIVLPLIIHLALHAASRAGRLGARASVVVVLLGLPIGFSRSGLVTLLVVLIVMLPFLGRAQRWTLGVASATIVLAGFAAAPDITRGFVELVVNSESDNSIEGRLVDYPTVLRLFGESPWIGNGPRFARDLSSVLDNQWLGTLVQDGVVGVLGLILLLGGGAALAAWSASRHPRSSPERSFNGALCAGLLGVAAAAGTFDVLSFQQATFIAFLLLGLVGVGQPWRRGEPLSPARSPARQRTGSS